MEPFGTALSTLSGQRAECLSRIKTGSGWFSAGGLDTQARMNAAANPLSESPESLTRDEIPPHSHAAKATLADVPPRVQTQIGKRQICEKQPKRTLRILKSRLAKCHVRCLRSNESYRRYLRHLEHCHGDEKICRFAHGGSCSWTFLHDDDSYRRRCDYQHGRVARLARHRQSQLHVPCNGSTGRTYEKTIGRAILDATWLFNSKFERALSKVRRDEGAVKRLVTKATA